MSYALLTRKESGPPGSRSKAAPSSVSGGLRIGEPNDAYEQEADRVADELMAGRSIKREWSLARVSTVAPPLWRKCACVQSSPGAECEECKKEQVLMQRKPERDTALNHVPPLVYDALRSPGQPLDAGNRMFFESRLGIDLRHVTIHVGALAARAASAINARAYTVGDHIVMDACEYSPQSPSGRRLLAHELAHVAQQSSVAGISRNLQSEAETPAPRAASGVADFVPLSPAPFGVVQLAKDDREWPALETWGKGIVMDLEPSTTSLSLPPEGVVSVWFHAKSSIAPPSIVRIHTILVNDDIPKPKANVIGQQSFNWFPEKGGKLFDERFRMELRTPGNITAAIAITDLDDARFQHSVWKLKVTQSAGPPAYAPPKAEPQPEYIVTGTASTAAASGTNFFFSGAGHDIENTGYIEGFKEAFAAAGIRNVVDVNVSSGNRALDISSTMALYHGPTQQTPAAVTSQQQAFSAASAPLSKGQRNLIGYSFGGAIAAATGRQLANQGIQVDNLVLIGTPVSIQFLRGLQISPNIKRVIVVNLPQDVIRPGTNPAVLANVLDPVVGSASVDPHFYFAEGKVNQPRREQLARILFELGVR